MNDAITAALGLLTLLVIVVVVVTEVGSRYSLDIAYDKHIGSAPIMLRNEWGQLRHTPEFMCEASIRQWLKECGK